jgi:hypothetical protein
METIFRKPNVTHFTISDHLEFHEQAYKLCEGYATLLDSETLLVVYQQKVHQEELVFKWQQRSEFTAKKAAADQARDAAFQGIVAIVKNDMKHFDPAVRDNALHLHNLLETYGNVTRVDYDGETANIDSLVGRLQSMEYFAAVLSLNLLPWVEELHSQNDLFKSYVDDATYEKLKKPEIVPIVARRQTDKALRDIINRVTSMAILNGRDGYAPFIDEFNVLADHYNNVVREHYGRLHARIDITPAAIDEIPAQRSTGHPVFVIPTLTLVVEKEGKQTTVSPVFSEDFTVAYRNNIEPGTATLLITGIGKYVGQITTTFNIVHA